MRSLTSIRTCPVVTIQTHGGRSRRKRSQRFRVNASMIKTNKIIKVCGVTSPEDARVAASSGADLIGMILWPKAGRSVSLDVAREIASVARHYGSEAVGVFVDEDAEAIKSACTQAGITFAQLHGDQARASFGDIGDDLRIIYVVHADKDGRIVTEMSQIERRPDWYLVDSLKGGSGESFDWDALKPPQNSLHGWLLAGGLNNENVSVAIRTAGPNGVDVSSGVCDDSKLKKDPVKVRQYISRASDAFRASLS